MATLWEAAKRGDLAGVQALLDSGADPNDVAHIDQPAGRTALHFAAAGDFDDVLALLLSRGAEIDATSTVSH